MNILVIDIGGTNVKLWRSGETEPLKISSGKKMTPEKMIEQCEEALEEWRFDRVSIGYPGNVLNGLPSSEPYNLGDGWVGFDYAGAFGMPVKVMNDACMQALGSYEGGRMLFLGLGTSMGTVYIIDGHIVPLSLGHLKFCQGESFEHHLSRKGLELYGVKRWRRFVYEAAEMLKPAFLAEYVVLGGGNAKKLKELPEGCRRGGNHAAFDGGVKMWEADIAADKAHTTPNLTLVPALEPQAG